MEEILLKWGPTGLIGIGFLWLLKSVLDSLKEITANNKSLTELIYNHIQHLIHIEEKQLISWEAFLLELKEHRIKTEDKHG